MAVKRAYSALSELRSAMSWQSLKTSSVYSFVWPVATILSMVSGMPLARMIDLEAGSYIRLARSAITSLEAAYNTGNGGISKQTEILGYRLPRTLWGRYINTYPHKYATSCLFNIRATFCDNIANQNHWQYNFTFQKTKPNNVIAFCVSPFKQRLKQIKSAALLLGHWYSLLHGWLKYP